MDRQSSPPLQGRTSGPTSPLHRIKKKPSSSKVTRRPTGYWQEFNAWYRAELANGTRPSVVVVDRWYEKNAVNAWPNKEDRPSGKDARSHAKSLRSTDEVKAYFQRYRAVKKVKGKATNEDSEVYPHSQGTAAPTCTLDTPASALERMPNRTEVMYEASLASLCPQHVKKVASMGQQGTNLTDPLFPRSPQNLPPLELLSAENRDPFGSFTANHSLVPERLTASNPLPLYQPQNSPEAKRLSASTPLPMYPPQTGREAKRLSAPDPLPLYHPNTVPSSTMTVTTCVKGEPTHEKDPWAMGIHSFKPQNQQHVQHQEQQVPHHEQPRQREREHQHQARHQELHQHHVQHWEQHQPQEQHQPRDEHQRQEQHQHQHREQYQHQEHLVQHSLQRPNSQQHMTEGFPSSPCGVKQEQHQYREQQQRQEQHRHQEEYIHQEEHQHQEQEMQHSLQRPNSLHHMAEGFPSSPCGVNQEQHQYREQHQRQEQHRHQQHMAEGFFRSPFMVKQQQGRMHAPPMRHSTFHAPSSMANTSDVMDSLEDPRFNGCSTQASLSPMDCDIPERTNYPSLSSEKFDYDLDLYGPPHQAPYHGRPRHTGISPRQHTISDPGSFASGGPSMPPPLFQPPVPAAHTAGAAPPLSAVTNVMSIDSLDLVVNGTNIAVSSTDTLPSSGERDLPKLDTLMCMKPPGDGGGFANPNLSFMPSWLLPSPLPSAHLSDQPSWVPNQIGLAPTPEHPAPSPLGPFSLASPPFHPHPCKEHRGYSTGGALHTSSMSPIPSFNPMNAPAPNSPTAAPPSALQSCFEGPRANSSPRAQLGTRQSAPPIRKLYYEHLYKDLEQSKGMQSSSGGTSSGSASGDLPPLTMSQSNPGSNALLPHELALASSGSHGTSSQGPPVPTAPPATLKSAFMDRQTSIASPFNTAAFTSLSDQLQLPTSHALLGAGRMQEQRSHSMGLPTPTPDFPLNAEFPAVYTAAAARMCPLTRSGSIPGLLNRTNRPTGADLAAAALRSHSAFQFEGLNDQDSLDMLKLQVSEWPLLDSGARVGTFGSEGPELPSALPANEISWAMSQNPSLELLRSIEQTNSQNGQAEPSQSHRAIPTTAC
eukprot:gene30261-35248_t